MSEAIQRIIEQNETELERRHKEDFKNVARAFESEEKQIVLKIISTEVLLDELKRRMTLLEDRDKAIKSLFKIQDE